MYTCDTSNSSKTPGGSSASATRQRLSTGSAFLPGTHASISISTSTSTGQNVTIAFTDSTKSDAQPSVTPFAGPSTYAAKEKRQSVIFPSPRCLRKYAKAHGDGGVSSACDCLGIRTPPPVTSIVTVSYQETITAFDSTTSVVTDSVSFSQNTDHYHPITDSFAEDPDE